MEQALTQHWRIITGDSRASLAAMPDCSVHCCVTSPPYWGLRDYGVEGQMGLEKSPAEFVACMVGVFREVRRVLRDDATCWVNIGDSYTANGSGGNTYKTTDDKRDAAAERLWGGGIVRSIPSGLKPKDICGVPWRLALALQDDGWYLRQDIIWAKPNPMPESVTDRCTKAHEYIFLLTKSARYWYDAKAIADKAMTEPHSRGGVHEPLGGPMDRGGYSQYDAAQQDRIWGGDTRNARSVWMIPTQPSSVPHYAMFPEELPRRCIKAGCPVGGVVLDPFSGMATTGKVAIELGRSYVGIELNQKYANDSRERLRGVSPMFAKEDDQ